MLYVSDAFGHFTAKVSTAGRLSHQKSYKLVNVYSSVKSPSHAKHIIGRKIHEKPVLDIVRHICVQWQYDQ